jgi:radical SAM superfamily enzyme YgiQ (UPF0313 family)
MNVLLISANTETINMPVLPLGLACVAAATRRAGHRVRQINLLGQGPGFKAIEAAVADFSPEVIGISVRNIDDQHMAGPRFLLEPVRDLVAGLRQISHAPVVLGGAGYSIFPEAALAYLGADYGIHGEGEVLFPALLDHLSRGLNPAGLAGICIPGQVMRKKIGSERPLSPDALPFPQDLVLPAGVSDRNNLWLPFQTRRGCPMACSYCSTSSIEGRRLRRQDPRAAVAALSRFVDEGFRQFFFVDNTFNLPPSHAAALCREILGRGLNIRFRCILYPWKVENDLVQAMAAAGCVEVSLGAESGSPAVLSRLHKRFSPPQVRDVSQRLGRAGIRQTGFLLLGGPGETRETVLESLCFIDSLGLDTVKVTVGIRIYPQTALSDIARRENVVSKEDSLLFPKFYLAPDLDGWLQETVASWMAARPHWVS